MSDLVGNPEDWFSHNEAHIGTVFQVYYVMDSQVQEKTNGSRPDCSYSSPLRFHTVCHLACILWLNNFAVQVKNQFQCVGGRIFGKITFKIRSEQPAQGRFPCSSQQSDIHMVMRKAKAAHATKCVVVLSSPEPLGSQGELIVYPSSRRPSVGVGVVRRSQCSKIFSSEAAGPIKAKFYVEPPWVG